MLRTAAMLSVLVASVFVGMQLVPLRVDNPPVRQEPAWASQQTRELAERACFDCHSNETVVPWYGHVAPASWLVRADVDEGRSELNFSEMDRARDEAREAAEVVLEGEMPPPWYVLLHPEARLTDAERIELAQGLEATMSTTATQARHDVERVPDEG